jgi:hypothetical protein
MLLCNVMVRVADNGIFSDAYVDVSAVQHDLRCAEHDVSNFAQGGGDVPQHRIYRMKFSGVYPLYVQKAERKNRTREEVDIIICWLTGYSTAQLNDQIDRQSTLETFFADAPLFNPNASLIRGVVCGVRVEEVEEPLMRKVRYLDKLIDELAKGKSLDKILRTP